MARIAPEFSEIGGRGQPVRAWGGPDLLQNCKKSDGSARAGVGRADSSSRAARIEGASSKYATRCVFEATRLTCLFQRNSHCHGHIFDAHGHQILLTSTFQRNLDCHR